MVSLHKAVLEYGIPVVDVVVKEMVNSILSVSRSLNQLVNQSSIRSSEITATAGSLRSHRFLHTHMQCLDIFNYIRSTVFSTGKTVFLQHLAIKGFRAYLLRSPASSVHCILHVLIIQDLGTCSSISCSQHLCRI